MRHRTWMGLLAATLLACGAFAAEETPVTLQSAIVSAGLFKNGLAVIKREVKLPGAGTFALQDLPEPVHGTWSVQCDAPVETRVAERDVLEPVTASNLDFQKALAGKHVTIHFRDGQIPPATGTIEAVPERKAEPAFSRSYQPRNYYERADTMQSANERFLILKTATGRIYLDSGLIAYVDAEGKDEGIRTRRPVLMLSLGKDADKPVTATITYLTKGIAWAPNYRVDITDPKQLTIEQSAVIKNELTPLDNAELQLISGYPSVQFGHVLSPLSLKTTWAEYFQQIRERASTDDNAAVLQQSLSNSNDRMRGATDLGAIPTGEGVDVFYQSIGPRTLAAGESLALNIDKQKAEYERLVEWIIPDTRNEYGYIQREKDDEDGAWDAVKFRNPFKFPMTTAPATVIANEHFDGQRMSYWVNAGEETTLHVTHALSIRTSSTEREEADAREQVWVGNRQYRRTNVSGELKLNNHRKEDVKIIIRRRFSGELLNADGAPQKSLREEGVYSVNARYELLWTITLKPGEEKALTYKYSVLTGN